MSIFDDILEPPTKEGGLTPSSPPATDSTDEFSPSRGKFDLSANASDKSLDKPGYEQAPGVARPIEDFDAPFKNIDLAVARGIMPRQSGGLFQETAASIARGAVTVGSGLIKTYDALNEMGGKSLGETMSDKIETWESVNQGGFASRPVNMSKAEFVTTSIGEMLPMIAMSMAGAGAGGALAKLADIGGKGMNVAVKAGQISSMASWLYGDKLEGIRQAADGRIPREMEYGLAAISTFTEALLEQIVGPEALFGKTAGFNAMAKAGVGESLAKLLSEKAAGGSVKNYFAGIAAESLTEIAQSLSSAVYEGLASEPGNRLPGRDEFKQAFEEGFMAIPSAAFFGGIASVTEYKARSGFMSNFNLTKEQASEVVVAQQGPAALELAEKTFTTLTEDLTKGMTADGAQAVSDTIRTIAYNWAAKTGRAPAQYVENFKTLFTDQTLTEKQINEVRLITDPQKRVEWFRENVNGYRALENNEVESYRNDGIVKQFEYELKDATQTFGRKFADRFVPREIPDVEKTALFKEGEALAGEGSLSAIEKDIERRLKDGSLDKGGASELLAGFNNARALEAAKLRKDAEGTMSVVELRAESTRRLYALRQAVALEHGILNGKEVPMNRFSPQFEAVKRASADMFHSLINPERNAEWIDRTAMRSNLAQLMVQNHPGMSLAKAMELTSKEVLADDTRGGRRGTDFSPLEAAFLSEMARTDVAADFVSTEAMRSAMNQVDQVNKEWQWLQEQDRSEELERELGPVFDEWESDKADARRIFEETKAERTRERMIEELQARMDADQDMASEDRLTLEEDIRKVQDATDREIIAMRMRQMNVLRGTPDSKEDLDRALESQEYFRLKDEKAAERAERIRINKALRDMPDTMESGDKEKIHAHYDPDARIAVFYKSASAEDVLHEWFHHADMEGLLPQDVRDAINKQYGRGIDTPDERKRISELAVRDFLATLRAEIDGVTKDTEITPELRKAFAYLKGVFASSWHAAESFGAMPAMTMESGSRRTEITVQAEVLKRLSGGDEAIVTQLIDHISPMVRAIIAEETAKTGQTPTADVIVWRLGEIYKMDPRQVDDLLKATPEGAVAAMKQALESQKEPVVFDEAAVIADLRKMNVATNDAEGLRLAGGAAMLLIDPAGFKESMGDKNIALFLERAAKFMGGGEMGASRAAKIGAYIDSAAQAPAMAEQTGAMESSSTVFKPEVQEFFKSAFESVDADRAQKIIGEILQKSMLETLPEKSPELLMLESSKGDDRQTLWKMLHLLGKDRAMEELSKATGTAYEKGVFKRDTVDLEALKVAASAVAAEHGGQQLEGKPGSPALGTTDALNAIASKITDGISTKFDDLSTEEKKHALRIVRGTQQAALRNYAKTLVSKEARTAAVSELLQGINSMVREMPQAIQFRKVAASADANLAGRAKAAAENARYDMHKAQDWMRGRFDDVYAWGNSLEDGNPNGWFSKYIAPIFSGMAKAHAVADNESVAKVVSLSAKHGAMPMYGDWGETRGFGKPDERGFRTQLTASEAVGIYMITDRGRDKNGKQILSEEGMKALGGSNAAQIGPNLDSVISDVIRYVEGMGDNGFVRYAKMGKDGEWVYTKDAAKAAREGMTATNPLKNWVAMTREYMDWAHQAADKAYFDQTGIHLPYTKNYFPRMRTSGILADGDIFADLFAVNWKERNEISAKLYEGRQFSELTEEEKKAVIEQEPGHPTGQKINQSRAAGKADPNGFLEHRNPGAIASPLLLNAPMIFEHYRQQVDVYRSKVHSLAVLNALISDKSFAQVMERLGDKEKIIQTLSDFTQRERFVNGRTTPFSPWEMPTKALRERFTVAVLAGKVFSMANQFVAGSKMFGELDIPHMEKYAANTLKLIAHMGSDPQRFIKVLGGRTMGLDVPGQAGEMFRRMMKFSPDILQRYGDPDLQDQKRGAFGSRGLMDFNIGKSTLADYAMGGFRIADLIPVMAGWNAAFDMEMAQLQRKQTGMTFEQMQIAAAKSADTKVSRTASASTVTDRNLTQTDNELMRMLFIFSGEPMKQFQYVRKQVWGPLSRGFRANGAQGVFDAFSKGEYGESAVGKRILFSFIIPAAGMFMLANKRLPEDEKEWAKCMASWSLTMVPLVGPILAYGIMKGGISNQAPVPYKILNEITTAVNKIVSGDPVGGVLRAGEAVGSAAGISTILTRFGGDMADAWVKGEKFEAGETFAKAIGAAPTEKPSEKN